MTAKKIINFIIRYFIALIKKKEPIIIPKIDISKIIYEEIPISIYKPIGIGGNISTLEIVIINTLIKIRNPITIFEIGTFNGRTSLNMAINSSSKSKVFTLDLPKNYKKNTKLKIDPYDKNYINKEHTELVRLSKENKIIQLFGDSATFDFSKYIGKIEFVFIDGAHSYDYVMNDSEIALKLLKKKSGIILWHDYGIWQGVTRALNELYCSNNKFSNLKHIDNTTLVYLIKD